MSKTNAEAIQEIRAAYKPYMSPGAVRGYWSIVLSNAPVLTAAQRRQLEFQRQRMIRWDPSLATRLSPIPVPLPPGISHAYNAGSAVVGGAGRVVGGIAGLANRAASTARGVASAVSSGVQNTRRSAGELISGSTIAVEPSREPEPAPAAPAEAPAQSTWEYAKSWVPGSGWWSGSSQ